MSGPAQSATSSAPVKGPRGGPRRIGDIWQWLGLSGDAVGTDGILRRTFLYAATVSAVVVGAIVTLNVITIAHDMPRLGLLGPVIWEGSSWISVMAFFWIPWLGYRLAPPGVRSRWWLLVHLPAALAYSLLHVGGFILLRDLAYRIAGRVYDFGSFVPNFLYELRKDALGYVLFVASFALTEHLLRQQQLIRTPGQTLTFDIRDGARLTRVRLSEILAITSAGNYVEFALADGRHLLMRSPLSAVESDLSGRGFVRTHRSWLVNEAAVTGLQPQGSGDYGVSLGSLTAPLSRRFPAALARLRAGKPA
jgi:hypothetical protein